MTELRRAFISLLGILIAVILIADVAWDWGADRLHSHDSGYASAVKVALAQILSFADPFDGAPPAPQPWHPTDWDVQIHQNESDEWKQFQPVQAEHGANCSAPPATHLVSTHEDAVFQCNDHIMTTIYSTYGLIYLTPNQMVDFTNGEAVVKFDLSTHRASTRDWIDVWITPYDDNLALPFMDTIDLNGPPRRAVHVDMANGGTGAFFRGSVVRGFAEEELPQATDRGYETVLTPSATRRDTFEVHVSRTRVRVGMPQYGLWWIDAPVADLGWSQGVVQFGHHTYNAGKGCIGVPEPCPGTWHWDNVQINPSVPFTIVRADRRYADATNPTVNFPVAAPSGARLRFGGFGRSMQVSFNGGATWQAAQQQAESTPDSSRFHSFWTPIPAGTTRVQFRASDIDNINWMARDISIFDTDAPPATPTPVPAATPVPTAVPTCAQPLTRVVKESAGILRATLTASGAGNTIRRVDFDPRGAVVRVSGLSDQVGRFTSAPQTATTSFQILQRTPGTSATVFLTVTDACGAHTTFVGGGPSAF
jgi:hypothetical protein